MHITRHYTAPKKHGFAFQLRSMGLERDSQMWHLLSLCGLSIVLPVVHFYVTKLPSVKMLIISFMLQRLDLHTVWSWTPEAVVKAQSWPPHSRKDYGYGYGLEISLMTLPVMSDFLYYQPCKKEKEKNTQQRQTALSHGLLWSPAPHGNSRCRDMGRETEINTAWSKASSTRLSG